MHEASGGIGKCACGGRRDREVDAAGGGIGKYACGGIGKCACGGRRDREVCMRRVAG